MVRIPARLIAVGPRPEHAPPSPDAESHGQAIPPVRPRAAACSTLAASTHRLPESWGERTRKRRTIIPTPTGAAPTGQTKPSPKSAATLNTKLSQVGCTSIYLDTTQDEAKAFFMKKIITRVLPGRIGSPMALFIFFFHIL